MGWFFWGGFLISFPKMVGIRGSFAEVQVFAM